MTVLLIAEHNNRNLKPATAQVVTAALEMGGPVDVLVLGNDCRSIAEEAAKIAGVRTAYFADNPQFAQESPEAIAEIVVREGKGYDHILFVTGALGKTVMPRVAALMDVSPVSEILAVKGPKTFVRGMYAGSILATVEVDEPVVVATVRGTAFAAAGEQEPALVEEVPGRCILLAVGQGAHQGTRQEQFVAGRRSLLYYRREALDTCWRTLHVDARECWL